MSLRQIVFAAGSIFMQNHAGLLTFKYASFSLTYFFFNRIFCKVITSLKIKTTSNESSDHKVNLS